MKEHYDRETFFAAVRNAPFPGRLTQSQVDGMNLFLDFWEPMPFKDRRCLAYCLGTQPIETGWTMMPIEEYGKGKGHKYGVPDSETGNTFYGRGYVQLTWKENYAKATKRLKEILGFTGDLVANPNLALDPEVAATIMVYGMEEGWFTGKKLSDYFNAKGSDWVNARRIVNGTDKASEIAGHAQAFYAALTKAATPAEPEQDAPEEPENENPTLSLLIEQIKGLTGAKEVILTL